MIMFMTTFVSRLFTYRMERFELVRYNDGTGRVYHLPTERIIVEDAHLVPDGDALLVLLDWWLEGRQTAPVWNPYSRTNITAPDLLPKEGVA